MLQLRHAVLLASALLGGCLAAPLLAEDGAIGLGLGHSSRFGATFVRGELVIPIGERWELVPNLEYLRANGLRRFVSSLDIHYKLPWRTLEGRLYGYLGAGLGVITEDPVGPNANHTSDGQVNFLGGVAFEGGATPFLELRSDARKVNLTVGVRLSL